jgi:hypothetical protein
MKGQLTILFFFFSISFLAGQNCDYDLLMREGRALFNKSQFRPALKKFNAARTCGGDPKSAEVDAAINKVFEAIEMKLEMVTQSKSLIEEQKQLVDIERVNALREKGMADSLRILAERNERESIIAKNEVELERNKLVGQNEASRLLVQAMLFADKNFDKCAALLSRSISFDSINIASKLIRNNLFSAQVNSVYRAYKPIGNQFFSIKAVTPDSRFILNDNFDVYRRSDGILIKTYDFSSDWAVDASLNHNASCILVSDKHKVAHFYNYEQNRDQILHAKHKISSNALNSDGQFALLGSINGTATLWRTTDSTKTQVFRKGWFPLTLTTCNITPDAKHVVVSGFPGRTKVWEVGLARPIGKFKGKNKALLSNDGRFLLSTSSNKTYLYQTIPKKRLNVFSTPQVNAIAIDTGANLIVTGGLDKIIRIWHRFSTTPIQEIASGCPYYITNLWLSTDSRFIFCDCGAEFSVFDRAPLYSLIPYPDVPPIVKSKMSADGLHFTTINSAGIVQFWEVGKLNPDFEVPIYNLEKSINRSFLIQRKIKTLTDLSEDGNTIANVSNDTTINYWQKGNLVPIFSYNIQEKITRLSLASDSLRLLILTSKGLVETLDPGSKQLRRFKSLEKPGSIAKIANNGSCFYVAEGSNVHFYRYQEFSSAYSIKLDMPATTLDITPDGKKAIIGTSSRYSYLWEPGNTNPITTMECYTSGAIDEIAISKNGDYFITKNVKSLMVDDACSIKLWRAGKDVPLQTISLPDASSVKSCTFSADANTILVTDENTGIQLWNTVLTPEDKFIDPLTVLDKIKFNLEVLLDEVIADNQQEVYWQAIFFWQKRYIETGNQVYMQNMKQIATRIHFSTITSVKKRSLKSLLQQKINEVVNTPEIKQFYEQLFEKVSGK